MPIVLVSTEGIETISAGKLPLLLRPQKGDGVGQRERERRAITPPEVLVEDRGKTIGKGEKKQKGEVKETRCWLA